MKAEGPDKCFGASAPRLSARRQILLDAARKLFCERGFHATGMAQISAEAGIKVGQIYRDFRGKEAIVAEIIQDDLERFLDEPALQAAIASGDLPAVRRWLGALLRREKSALKRQLLPEILAEAARNGAVACMLQTADARMRSLIGAALAALVPGQDKAERRSHLTDLILTLMIGTSQRLVAMPDLDEAEVAGRFASLIERELDRLEA